MTTAQKLETRNNLIQSVIARLSGAERFDRFDHTFVFGQLDNGQYTVFQIAKNAAKAKVWYRFSSENEALKYFIKLLDIALASIEAVLNRTEARAAGHTLKVGDTLYTSWGYDQTNVSFYRVVAVPSKHRVDVVELTQTVDVEDYSSGRTYPGLKTIGKVERKTARENRVINIDGRDNAGYFYGPERKGVGCSWGH